MQYKNNKKGKGVQLKQQLNALNETIGTKLMTIKACHVARRQGLANEIIMAILLQDAFDRFKSDLETILEVE